ncbi:MAG: hypothetical protein EP326_01140 [Deltaproteobacteria bacterium]|nr:MAG: hypothetical protein EP326_01140 [Deltaproteobacteria bacterium]
MIKLGLLGKDISHSRSQEIYEKLLSRKIDYTLFDYESEDEIPEVQDFFNSVEGLSITAPYKRVFLDSVEMNSDIQELGAINCIRKVGENFEGTNTDYLALLEIIDGYKKLSKNLGVVLLGDGAMATVLLKIFKAQNIKFKQFSRKLNNDFSSLSISKSLLKECDKIVVMNACSRNYLFNGHIDSDIDFYDLNYSNKPQENFFSTRSNKYIDGIELLEGQARHALKFWGID